MTREARSSDELAFAKAWVAKMQTRTVAGYTFVLLSFITIVHFALNDPGNIRFFHVRLGLEWLFGLAWIIAAIAVTALVTKRSALETLLRRAVPVLGAAGLVVLAIYAYEAIDRQRLLAQLYPDTLALSPRIPEGVLMGSIGEGVAGFACFLTFSVVALLLSQVPVGALLLLSVATVCLTVFVTHGHPQQAFLVATALPLLAGATVAGVGRLRGQFAAAYGELERQRLAEREAVLDYEKDLEVARRIHDAIMPPAVQRFHNYLNVHTYREAHATIGGDWLGVHETQNGALVLAVADVNGKGVQAALTAHAIQSVWILTTQNADFDASSFLASLSSTLGLLGQRKIQTATMGLLTIKNGEVEYWSAAHCPLHLLRHKDDGTDETKVWALKGEPLGIGATFEVDRVSFTLPADERASILIGSDGVLKHLDRERESSITLLKDMRKHGIGVIKQLKSDDDKTLIWLEYTPSPR